MQNYVVQAGQRQQGREVQYLLCVTCLDLFFGPRNAIPYSLDREMPSRTLELTLAALALLGPFAIHLFFPVIPFVKVDFELSDALAQLTFSLGVFGMAFSTLVYGTFGPLRPPSSVADRSLSVSRGKHHLGVCNFVCRSADR